MDDLVSIPEHLQTEFELVLHLVQDVGGASSRTQQLHDVVVGLEHGAVDIRMTV
jgi:hypothetical protein